MAKLWIGIEPIRQRLEGSNMTDADWERVNQDTQRAIEDMKRRIAIAEVGKKKERKNDNAS